MARGKRVKAYARSITLAQANSYDRLVPNKLGVTSIAEVNGADSYERRYRKARALLGKPLKENGMRYTARQARFIKRSSPARRAAFMKMLAGSGGKRGAKGRFKRNRKAYGARAAEAGAAVAAPVAAVQERRARGAQKRAKALAKKERARAKKLRATAKRRKTRLYGGRYVAVRARVAGKNRRTYQYRTKKGAYRHIPEHGVLGYPTRTRMKRAMLAGDKRYEAAKARLDKRRARDAEKASKAILAGRGLFSPNRRGKRSRVLTFEEWKMNRNPKNPTKKQKAASRRNIKKAQAALAAKRVGKKRVGPKRARKSGSAAKRTKKLTKAQAKARRFRGLRAYHRACRAGKVYAPKRKARKARKATRKTSRKYVGKKGKKRALKKNRVHRRSYRRNAADDYTTNLMGALKIGTIVLAGYVAHRALTKLLNDQALAKVEFLNKGEVANWRKTIASAIVAAIGVPLVVKLMPKESAASGAGIAVSFLHGLLVDVLKAAKQEDVVGYLAAYPDDEGSVYYGSGLGRSLGSYYTYGPGQVFNGARGFGEYYQTQAGQLTAGQLTQAAAGFGQVPRLQQAAAGMGEYLQTGAENAMVTQAAAGEYLAYGARGVGASYEEIPVRGTAMTIYDEGAPNMRSAEQALNIVEAAAGVGATEIPYEANFDPTLNSVDIPNGPGDSRGGIFGTPGGIFGGSAL